jgi:hypothetical protein
MASSWIRVDAEVGGDARVARARRILKVTRPTMVGMLVLLEIELLKQNPSGELAAVDTDTLAEWAGFEGKPEVFGQALELLTVDGRIYGWEDRHGVLLHRLEKDKRRKRELRDKRRAERDILQNSARRPEDGPTDNARTSAPNPLPTERRRNGDGTERNGTETTPLEALHPTSNKRGGEAAAEHPADRADRPAPPADAGTSTADLPRDAVALLDRFYPADNPRRRDVAQQLRASLGAGAKFDKGTTVRAGSVDRLAAKCREVLDEHVRVPDSAIRLLLIKLGDTSDGSAPGVTVAKIEADEQRRDEQATAADEATAERWLNDHLTVAASIEEQLNRDGFAGEDDFTRMGRRMARRNLVLAAWSKAELPRANNG